MVDRPLMTSRRSMTAGSDVPEGEGTDDPARADEEGLIRLTGTMKWFDATRGFGFLVSDDVTGDILVHFSVLKEHDRRSLPEGAVVECLVAEQERGLQARRVLSIDLSQAVMPEPQRSAAAPGERGSLPLARRCRGFRAGPGQMVQPPQGLWLPRPRGG